MTQKPMLRVEVGAVSAAGARASRIKVTRERTGGRGQARLARRLVVRICVCDSDSLAIMKKIL
jgi:hypothetical protein